MNRIEHIRAECAAEAGEREHRFVEASAITGNIKQPAGANADILRKAMNRTQARDASATIPPDRTPCPRCATRSDLGCKHQAAS